MPNSFDWTSVKRDWAYQLDLVGVQQREVADFLGISTPAMTKLVKAMTDGKGLTASALDKERWDHAVNYIKLKQSELQEV